MSLTPSDLQTIAETRIGFDSYFKNLERGRAYLPLFGRIEKTTEDGNVLIWINSWLITPAHMREIEKATEFQVSRYIQEGFHPSSWQQKGRRIQYEGIYGRGAEPLVLGWSADTKRIDGTLSQEFERYYQLIRHDPSSKETRWNSWRESIDDVVIRQIEEKTGSVIVLSDFINDFQDVRRRWCLVAYFGQWYRSLDLPQHQSLNQEARQMGTRRTSYFGVLNDKGNDFDFIEFKGYILIPPPKKPQFTRSEAGVPPSLRATTDPMDLQTSSGAVKPSSVRDNNYKSGHFSNTVIFDQEVLRRYQEEPRVEASVDRLGALSIRARRLHLVRSFYLLGTEYVSTWLGYFVEQVPESEWLHWRTHNIAYIGDDQHRKLMEEPSLFSLTRAVSQLPLQINATLQQFTGDSTDRFFKEAHYIEKDTQKLCLSLPRRAALGELLDRAQALDGLITEWLSQHDLRAFLKKLGFPSKKVESFGSLILFTTCLGTCHVASRALTWTANSSEALQYGAKRMQEWTPSVAHSGDEDAKIIKDVLKRCDVLFGINKLRLESGHAMSSDLETRAKGILNQYCECEVSGNDYRDAILLIYTKAIDCLKYAMSFGK